MPKLSLQMYISDGIQPIVVGIKGFITFPKGSVQKYAYNTI